MEKRITVNKFRNDIRRLPSDEPVSNAGVWYQTQKQHWLGWLYFYDGPGAYGREPGMNRDAKYAYNHIVCPGRLLYLIKAIGIDPELVSAAEEKMFQVKL